ncbi:MAG: hypothetical protein ACLR6J_14350 [Parabacteroides merdae]
MMLIFVRPDEAGDFIGTEYLRIEGALFRHRDPGFLLYGYYRAIRMPGMSVAYHSVSLGHTCRPFLLARHPFPLLGSPVFGGLFLIGWFLADLAGIAYYHYRKYAVSRT